MMLRLGHYHREQPARRHQRRVNRLMKEELGGKVVNERNKNSKDAMSWIRLVLGW